MQNHEVSRVFRDVIFNDVFTHIKKQLNVKISINNRDEKNL